MPPKKRKPTVRTPQAPARRDGGSASRPSWSHPAILAGIAAAALAIGVGAIVLVGRNDGGEASIDAAMAAANCTFATYPDQGQNHVDSYDAKIDYNSTPPTSGPHHQVPVIWGAYSEEVPAVAEVHNLEHGGMIIHYGDKVDVATREQLRAFYDDSPNGMLLSPMPALGDKVSLTAWTKLATCTTFDEDAFSSFRSAFRGNGPERFRVGDLQPGT